MSGKKARLAGDDGDYDRLKLKPEIEPWEDGLRTSGKKGEYEWWYFDGKMEDGSSLVVVFYTAPITADKEGFHPSLSFTLTRPDGSRLADSADWTGKYSFSSDRCRVQMGANSFEGDLHTYRIHYANGGIVADIRLVANISSWRPETGHICFGEKQYFAWLPAVPEGTVTATVLADGLTTFYQGSGYHDHNWGNAAMYTLMHHWYWGRARIGDYQVITSYITGRRKYGYEHFMIFMLAKDGQILADKGQHVTFTQTEPLYHPSTRKHYHKQLEYAYDDGISRYRVTYQQQELVEEFSLTDSKEVAAAKTSGMMRLMMRLAGLDPAYIRMTGTARLERFAGDALVETVEAPALWELMYFGKDRDV